jgi:spore maturation protein CgeB
MRVVIFCHSIRSDWNHGNAHFLRGISTELQRRGHHIALYEPADGWSAAQLAATEGRAALDAYRTVYPTLAPVLWNEQTLDLERAVHAADLVLVHEWNPPDLVARLGRLRARGAPFSLLFHDTHHRSDSSPDDLARLDLSGYDGVLAFGEVIRERYLRAGWARRVWTWHEAADTTVFYPRRTPGARRDLVWIGNWGDGERSRELHDFLLAPAAAAGLSGDVHGVRYPTEAIAAVEAAGLTYRGWLPNHRAPEVFAEHRVTVHVPRRPYVERLPGIPTIRVFEALACGIPLVCAPWHDSEGLFRPGEDYLVAHDGAQMARYLQELVSDQAHADALASSGRATIAARHTCAHRVDELMAVLRQLTAPAVVHEEA